MNHSQAIFGGEQRKWWIALVTLLAALALVQQAGADLTWTLETSSAAFGNTTDSGVDVHSGGYYPSNGDIWLNIPILGELWNSSDGITWNLLSTDFPTDESSGSSILEFNGDFYTFYKDDIFNSSDGGITWDVVTYTSGYPLTRNPGVVVKDNKMWLWGGYYSGIKRGCYNSSDGITWTTVTSDIGYDMWGGAYGYFDPYFYYIGGYGDPRDIYYSSNGATWTLLNDVLPVDVYAGSPIMEYDGSYYIITSDACYMGGSYGMVLRSSDLTTWEVLDDGNGGDPAWYSNYDLYYKYAVYSLNGDLYVAGGRGFIGPEEDPVFNSYTAEIWSAPIPSSTPPDPGPDDNYLYWKLVKDGFQHSVSTFGQLVEHNNVLFILQSPTGILYENPSGNPYSAWYTVGSFAVWPYNSTSTSGNARYWPGVAEYNDTIWVVGGNTQGTPISNDTWRSSSYITWLHPNLLTWERTSTNPWSPGAWVTDGVGFTLLSFDGYLWRIGGEGLTSVSRTVTGADTWDVITGSLPFEFASTYADESYIYAIVANESGNNSVYRSSNGASWTLLNDTAMQYRTAPDNVLKNVVEWDGKLWYLGGGLENGYYSRNEGYNWHFDRNYTEYPEIDHTTSFITYDATGSIPEMIYSYSYWTGELWAGAYFPVAEFSGTPLSGVKPLTVQFTDSSINMGSGVGTTSWLWTFGDGETSTTQNPSHTYSEYGTYDVSLSVSNVYGSDTETKTGYVTVGDVAGVSIFGHIYDAISGDAIPSANISFLQYATYHNTTSNATGGYNFGSVFYKDESINTDSTKTGYTSWPTNFMVLANGTYEYDLYMIPFDSWNSTGIIGGFVYDEVWSQGIPNATVNMWNGTWSDTNLTNSAGFYWFENITSTDYSLNATASTFDNSSTYVITGNATGFVQQDIPLSPNYQMDLMFKNSETLAYIYDTITVVLINATSGSFISQSNTTNSTFITGLIDYGLYNLTASCDGYYPAEAEIYLYTNVTGTIYLDPIANYSGANTNYVPHPVRFTYVDAYGNPIVGATVTATALESTNPWDWLSGVFGYQADVDIQNTVLSGTTGHDGTLSFLMVETVQYRVNCVKTISGIDHTVDIYPKESEYFIRIGSLPLVGSYPTYSLNATTVGGNVVLFGNYTDTSGSSSGVRFIVRNSTGSEVYNTSVTLTGGVGSASYAVNNTKGTQLTFGITSEHTTQGHIEKWIDITLKGTGRLVDFGSGWTDFMYLAMSLAGIFLVAGCFGEIDTRLGAIFIPITAGMFWTIGWMGEVYGPLITIAGVLGALYYMRSKAKELDT
jgi:PKD repeat protein